MEYLFNLRINVKNYTLNSYTFNRIDTKNSFTYDKLKY